MKKGPSQKECYKRLKESQKLSSMLAKRFDAHAIDRLWAAFSVIPQRWVDRTEETVSEQLQRQKRLAKKVRCAASAMQEDPYAQFITLLAVSDFPGTSGIVDLCWNSKMTNRPTVGDFLSGLADDIEARPPYSQALDRRITLSAFACISVFYELVRLDKFKRRPLRETATIVSVLLGTQINANSLAKNADLRSIMSQKKYSQE